MDDEDLIKKFRSVTDPREACRVFMDNVEFIGFDPYYRDLHNAMMEMLERCGQESSNDDVGVHSQVQIKEKRQGRRR